MPKSQQGVTDSRAFERQLQRELIIGGLVIGTIVGVGIIFLLWGQAAALTALSCFVLFLGLIGLVWLILVGFAWLGKE